jgi:hypothetical protein
VLIALSDPGLDEILYCDSDIFARPAKVRTFKTGKHDDGEGKARGIPRDATIFISFH